MAATLLPRSLFSRAAFAVPRATTSVCMPTQTPFTSAIFTSIKREYTVSAVKTHAAAFQPSPLYSRISQRRYASATAAPVTHTAASSPTKTPLTWDQFLGMRGRRRYVNLGFAVAGAITAAVFGSPLIGALDIDTTVAQATGMDPLIVIAAGSLVVAAVGWFAGRVVGSIAFSAWARQRGWSKAIAEKEKSFFDRIKRFRADPTSSSPQNPIPDYYGEKIGSVKDYRKWLKDQRTYNKKMYRGVR